MNTTTESPSPILDEQRAERVARATAERAKRRNDLLAADAAAGGEEAMRERDRREALDGAATLVNRVVRSLDRLAGAVDAAVASHSAVAELRAEIRALRELVAGGGSGDAAAGDR